MKQKLNLFIGDREVEFSSDPQILYNYTITDCTNPTVVKNSYSKTITIPGTPNNNDVFGHIWNFERLQGVDTGVYSGTIFNPLRKADFTLYLNGEIYESGYLKLTEVRKTGKNGIEYDVTLFGGLGSFYYNLSFLDSEEEYKKLTLADLSYRTDTESEPDLNFKINKDTIFDAWHTINGDPNAVYDESDVNRPNNYLKDDKWDVINFAPAYNGIPSDFDADKTLINTYGTDEFITSKDGYTTVDGFSLGEASEEMTEWETFDLRSYMQRPVIRMKRIIEACCNPDNNGGYKVELDPHFFRPDNPYWEDSWLTLKMLRDLDIPQGEVKPVTSARIVKERTDFYEASYSTPTMSKINDLSMDIKIKFNPEVFDETYETLYPSWDYNCKGGATVDIEDVKKYSYTSGVIVQMFGLDDFGNIIGASDAYLLTDKTSIIKKKSLSDKFKEVGRDYYKVPVNNIQTINGCFRLIDEEYVFCSYGSDEPLGIHFNLNKKEGFRRVMFKVTRPYQEYVQNAFGEGFVMPDKISQPDTNDARDSMMFIRTSYKDNSYKYIETVRSIDSVKGNFQISIDSFSVSATDYDAFFSNSLITKDKLLNTENTPCDYLLSYCKMFGLYFYKDASELAEDQQRYPNGVIHIVDRNTFYRRDDVVDIQQLVDRSKTMKMTPQVAASKWYDFSIEQVESDANNSYQNTYGMDYGLKRINTGYNFDSETTKLYDSSLFKAGVMVQEKDKYFTVPIDGLPAYYKNGLTYNLYKKNDDGEYDTLEIENPVSTWVNFPLNNKDLKQFDLFPKVQFHKENNEATDGDGVLLFYNGFKFKEMDYIDNRMYLITDDVQEMISLNDGNPCWIMSKSEYCRRGMRISRIAYKESDIPMFSRYRYNEDSGFILHSFDFGNPQETYIPDTYTRPDTNVYDRCWKNFISDMYSVNSRILNCYVLLEERPNPEWLRRFYWFDNAIWRLNKISDWNIASFDTTSMEFIKVQDLENYSLNRIDDRITIKLNVPYTKVSTNGAVIPAYVEVLDGGPWDFEGVSEGITLIFPTVNGDEVIYVPYDGVYVNGELIEGALGVRGTMITVGDYTNTLTKQDAFNIIVPPGEDNEFTIQVESGGEAYDTVILKQ